jgi:hypothetical protein
LGKQLGHRLAQLGNESGQRREVRLTVPGNRHEQDVLPTRGFNPATADQAATVGQQDDFEEHGGIVGGSALFVVLVAPAQFSKIDFAVNQVTKGVFEAAQHDLLREVDGQQHKPCLNRFKSRHPNDPR